MRRAWTAVSLFAAACAIDQIGESGSELGIERVQFNGLSEQSLAFVQSRRYSTRDPGELPGQTEVSWRIPRIQ